MRRSVGVAILMLAGAIAVFQSLAWHSARDRRFAADMERARDLLPVPPASVEPFVYNPGHPQGPQLVIDANRLSAQTEVCIVREGATRCDLLAEIFRRLPQ